MYVLSHKREKSSSYFLKYVLLHKREKSSSNKSHQRYPDVCVAQKTEGDKVLDEAEAESVPRKKRKKKIQSESL